MSLHRLTLKEAMGWPSRQRAHFFNTLSGFKPVHLLGTQRNEGVNNLAIFSQVFHVGANPPLLGVLFRPATVPRHSLSNIRETGYFTLNHVSESLLEQAHQTAAKYEADESEFDQVNLTPVMTNAVSAPYVAEADVRIGLKFKEEQLIKANETILVIGEIQEVFYPKEALKEDGYLDLASLNIAACTGMDAYHIPQKAKRFSYAQPDKPVSELDKSLF